MKEKNIHKIIDLYFDAQLAQFEEEELFNMLLTLKGEDNKVKEALAVMLVARNTSVLSAQSGHSSRNVHLEKKISRFRYLKRTVAVALAAVFCSCAFLYNFHNSHGLEKEGMMAYVGGVKINDHSEIMKIVDDQLNDISISSEFFSQTIDADLDDIRNALKEEGL